MAWSAATPTGRPLWLIRRRLSVCVQDALGFAEGLAVEFQPVGVMDQPVQDCVGDGGIVNHLMPLVHRELAGDEGRTHSLPVVQDLQQVAILFTGDGRHAEVVDHEQGRPVQLFEQLQEAAVGLGVLQFPEQFGCVVVTDPVAVDPIPSRGWI